MDCFQTFSQDIESNTKFTYIDILYGVAYEPEDYNSIGHPFFVEDKIFKANIWYEGVLISNVFIKYDLYNQVLVLYQNYSPNKYRFIKINTLGVDKLDILDENKTYTLVPYWKYHELSDKIIFYEEIYSSNLKYLVGYTKNLDELAVDTKNKFSEKQINIIIRDGVGYEVRNKKDILNLFKDHKAELKVFIRKNKLKIKLNNKKDIVRLIAYYEQLLTQ